MTIPLSHTQAKQSCDVTSKEYIEEDCRISNALEGNLKGYDCPKCKNKGVIYKPSFSDFYGYWTTVAVRCDCMPIREELIRREKSGLNKLLKRYTFKNYKANENWQKRIAKAACDYVRNPERWFYIGGQPGSGKTHICTAIVNALLARGKAARYMIWQDEIIRLKQSITEADRYKQLLDGLKKAEILYIDDFFKVQNPTNADIDNTFKIINYRYNESLPTIISSELSISQIINIDEALGSRIAEMTDKNSAFYIPRDKKRNIRTNYQQGTITL